MSGTVRKILVDYGFDHDYVPGTASGFGEFEACARCGRHKSHEVHPKADREDDYNREADDAGR